jgi:mxaL protein
MKVIWTPRFLFLVVAVCAAALAATQPTVRRGWEARNLMLVVDVTRSMMARDQIYEGAPESRLAMLRHRLPALIGGLPPGSRVGLSIFTERRSFVLFEPTDVQASYAALSGAIAALDWRMAWEGDSRVASGLQDALMTGAGRDYDLVFLTDGQEAPPLPWTGGPQFRGEVGAVGGLVVGVGGSRPVPIPKFDDRGREVGAYVMTDVPQESRTGRPPPDAESRPGFHLRNNPFGDMPPGTEHLTEVREGYLTELSAGLGLGYAGLARGDDLDAAILRFTRPRTVVADVDLSPVLGGVALAAAFLAHLWAFFDRRSVHGGPSIVRIKKRRIPMFKSLILPACVAFSVLLPGVSLAHGPTPQKVDEGIDIATPCELVWSTLLDFGSIGSWHPGITAVEASGASERGATRTLTLANGESVTERLDNVDGARQAISYRLSQENLKALPVSFYTAKMVVSRPDPGPTCHVDWEGRFYRGDTTNEPAEDMNDEAAVRAMTAFLSQGLEGLKAHFE